MFGRVDARQPAGEHGDGAPARIERGFVGDAVDAAGQAGDHGPAGAGQTRGNSFGHPPAVARALAGTDDADALRIRLGEGAPVIEQLRGVVDSGQARRVR